MTAVRDTVYKSDGSLASGTVVITWRPFVTADNKPVFGGTKTVPLSNGSLAVALVPNQGGTPSGTSYTVKYYQSGNVFSEETWVVPSSNALPSPGAPTVTNAGTPGSTTYHYWVSAKNASGETLLGPSGVTTTSNSTLDGTNYNQISWSTVSGATSYRVWRTATSTAPSGTGNYLVGETSGASINDQSNSLQQATIPSLNDTDPRTLADVRVTAAPSSTVTLAASQVNGTAIVSNPSATQTINAPPKTGVIPLQVKGQPQANANILEIYDSQPSPVLQSYFNPQGAFVSHQPLTNDHTLSGQGDRILQGGASDSSFTTAARDWFDAANGYNSAFAFKSLNPPTSHGLGGVSLIESDSAGVQYLQGFSGVGVSNHSSGTRPSASGLEGVAVQNAGGITTDLAGGYFRTDTHSGNAANSYGVLIDGNTKSSGTVTNNYGLKILNQSISGANNWAIKTGTGKVQFGDAVLAPTINNVRYADQFAGANAGAKIAAASADLPSTGGVVDARGLVGNQTFSTNPFICDKPALFLFGGIIADAQVPMIVAGTDQMCIVEGAGRATVFVANAALTSYTNSDAAARKAVFVVGQTTNQHNTRITNLKIDCNSVASSIGLYTESANEGSGGEFLQIQNCDSRGIQVEDTTGGEPANYFFREDWIIMDAASTGIGFEVDSSIAIGHRGADGITVVQDASTKTLAAAFQLTGGGEYTRLHAEDAVDCVVVAGFVHISGLTGSNCTDLVQINTGGSGIFKNIRADSGTVTNTLVDAPRSKTFATASFEHLQFYATSAIHGNDLGSSAQPFSIGFLSSLSLNSNTVPIFTLNRTTGSGVVTKFTNTDDTAGFFLGLSGSEKFAVGRNVDLNTSPFLTIDQSGNIGIGPASPATKLDVDGAIRSTMKGVTFSATPTFDASLGNSFKITLTDNVTSSTLSNAQAGQEIVLILCQDATGGRTMTWPTDLKLPGDSLTLTSTANRGDTVTARYDGARWMTTAVVQNMSCQ